MFWKIVFLIRKINKRYCWVFMDVIRGQVNELGSCREMVYIFFNKKIVVLLGRFNFLVKYVRCLIKYDVIVKDQREVKLNIFDFGKIFKMM